MIYKQRVTKWCRSFQKILDGFLNQLYLIYTFTLRSCAFGTEIWKLWEVCSSILEVHFLCSPMQCRDTFFFCRKNVLTPPLQAAKPDAVPTLLFPSYINAGVLVPVSRRVQQSGERLYVT